MRGQQVAQVAAGDRRGSGYLVNATTVLTAAHVVGAEAVVTVRVDPHADSDGGHVGRVAWASRSVDIALVVIEPAGQPAVEDARFARLEEDGDRRTAEALGYPRYKLTSERPAGDARPVSYRDTLHVQGILDPWSNRRSGTLSFAVDADPVEDRAHSAWGGMSGAAV